jgi:hypothetical protein
MDLIVPLKIIENHTRFVSEEIKMWHLMSLISDERMASQLVKSGSGVVCASCLSTANNWRWEIVNSCFNLVTSLCNWLTRCWLRLSRRWVRAWAVYAENDRISREPRWRTAIGGSEKEIDDSVVHEKPRTESWQNINTVSPFEQTEIFSCGFDGSETCCSDIRWASQDSWVAVAVGAGTG